MKEIPVTDAIPHAGAVAEFFKARNAVLVGFYIENCPDGTVYYFYRGKIRGKSGDSSAPRGLIVVEASGEVRPMREIGSWERKKLRHTLKKFRRKST